jgi:hypothetical protein
MTRGDHRTGVWHFFFFHLVLDTHWRISDKGWHLSWKGRISQLLYFLFYSRYQRKVMLFGRSGTAQRFWWL